MRVRFWLGCSTLLSVCLVSLCSGCGQREDTANGPIPIPITPVQQSHYQQSQIANVQSNPRIPAAERAQVIAAYQGASRPPVGGPGNYVPKQ